MYVYATSTSCLGMLHALGHHHVLFWSLNQDSREDDSRETARSRKKVSKGLGVFPEPVPDSCKTVEDSTREETIAAVGSRTLLIGICSLRLEDGCVLSSTYSDHSITVAMMLSSVTCPII